VIYSADVSQRLEGNVTRRLYPNMGHTINADELDVVRELMAGLVAQPDPAVVR
jgi:phospholipase/carboxylesterase